MRPRDLGVQARLSACVGARRRPLTTKTIRLRDLAVLGCDARPVHATLCKSMTTAELQKKRVTDEEVVAWRADQLRRAGCDPAGAEILARRGHVDLHEAVELLERGCPSHFALEILL